MTEDNDLYQAPAASVDLSTEDSDDVMVAYLGNKNAEYYLRVFKKFETGGGILSWNWAAFFLTSPWFLYRRLWIWFFVFWLGLPFVAITVGVLSAAIHPVFGMFMFVVMYFCLVPVFANFIFYRRALDHVAAAKSVSPRIETQMAAAERLGGTNEMGAWIFGVIVYSLFTANMLFNVIPAMKNVGKNLRSVPQEVAPNPEISLQVEAAVNASIESRQAVELYYLEHARYPLTNDEAETSSAVSEEHVSGTWIHEGRVIIIFNDSAHEHLRGEQLFMIPNYTGNGFAWSCGSASINKQYLPIRCRL